MSVLRATGILLGLLAVASCRPKPPQEVVVADDEATPEQTEALAALSPPWKAPARALLDNQLLAHWLVETGRATAHVRFVFPTRHLPADQQGTAAALVAESMGHELGRRLRRYNATTDVTHKPGRIEIAFHVPDSRLEVALKAAALVLARPTTRAIEAMQTRMVDQTPPLTTEARATGELVALLLGHDPRTEQFDPVRLVQLDVDTLIATWKQLSAPELGALIVHAARPLDDPEIAKALDVVAKRWRGATKLEGAKPTEKIHARLGIATAPPESASGLLMPETGKPPPILHVEPPPDDRKTQPTLLLARVVPTPTAEDRSRARLAQRLLQEQYDARVTIAGAQAIWMIKIPIKKGRVPRLPWLPKPRDDKKKDASDDPRREFTYLTLEAILSILHRRQPVQHLYQAAELWLGANMVRASLAGEDWTALWSQAIDLSTRERDVVGALARDARAMLTTKPEDLVTWQTKWLDYRAGSPGWQWLAIGKRADIKALLRPLGKLKTIELTSL